MSNIARTHGDGAPKKAPKQFRNDERLSSVGRRLRANATVLRDRYNSDKSQRLQVITEILGILADQMLNYGETGDERRLARAYRCLEELSGLRSTISPTMAEYLDRVDPPSSEHPATPPNDHSVMHALNRLRDELSILKAARTAAPAPAPQCRRPNEMFVPTKDPGHGADPQTLSEMFSMMPPVMSMIQKLEQPISVESVDRIRVAFVAIHAQNKQHDDDERVQLPTRNETRAVIERLIPSAKVVDFGARWVRGRGYYIGDLSILPPSILPPSLLPPTPQRESWRR